MNCVFYPELKRREKSFSLENEEFKHIKALRLVEGDESIAVNGKGLAARCSIEKIRAKQAILRNLEFYEEFGESVVKTTAAAGLIADRNRFEYALEKSVELGVVEFIPLITTRVQKKKTNIERLRSKAIAAVKQSLRSRVPVVSQPKTLNEVLKSADKYDTLVVLDINGEEASFDFKTERKVIVFVGPEGGFTDKELRLLKSFSKTKTIKLSERRLRSETALAAALSLIEAESTRLKKRMDK